MDYKNSEISDVSRECKNCKYNDLIYDKEPCCECIDGEYWRNKNEHD